MNEADHSQPEGTNIQAFLADWQCAEDELMNELKEDVGWLFEDARLQETVINNSLVSF